MPARALVVHPSSTAVAEIRDVLAQHVTVDASHTEVDAIRRLGDEEYAVVIIDYKPPLDAKRIAAETVAAQPDAFIVMMTPDVDSGRELDQSLAGKVFRFLAGPISAGSSPASSPRACGCRSSSAIRRSSSRSSRSSTASCRSARSCSTWSSRSAPSELQVAYDRLKAASRQALLGLAEAIEAKDPYTKGHCGRTAVYSTALGREARLSDERHGGARVRRRSFTTSARLASRTRCCSSPARSTTTSGST